MMIRLVAIDNIHAIPNSQSLRSTEPLASFVNIWLEIAHNHKSTKFIPFKLTWRNENAYSYKFK